MRLIANGNDITQFYKSVKWSGSKNEAARKLDFEVVVSGTDKNLPKLWIAPESEVRWMDDDGNVIFIGRVIHREKSIGDNLMSVSCVDPLYFLKQSKGSFTFKDEPPQKIAQKVLGVFGLTTGKLEPASPVTRTFDVESLYNIVMIAYKLDNEKTKKPYAMRMKGEEVEVVEQGEVVARYQLDAKSNLYDAKYSDDASKMITHVKMFDTDGKEIGDVEKKIEMMESTGKRAAPQTSTAQSTAGPLKGSGNRQKAWNFFKENGFSDAAAAGILGNLMQESGVNVNPSLAQYGGGPGRGIAQWTIGSDRWHQLNAHAKKKGRSWTDLEVQLEFMMIEMQNGNAYWKRSSVSSMESYKQSTDVKQAVYDFERSYERAGKPNYANRIKYANQCMKEYGGSAPVGAKTIYRAEKNEDEKARAEAKLTELEKAASIRVKGDVDLVTGNAVIVKEPFTGLNGKFYIESDTHTWEDNKHMCELELAYKNVMADVETAEKKADSLDGSGSVPRGDGSARSRALEVGKGLIGLKYQWGGNTPQSGLDCTGFVDWCYTQAGMPIPGRLQSHALRRDPAQFNLVEIPWDQRQPGDILWQDGHCAMQYYDGQILESGGTTKSKRYLGYSGVGITSGKGRRFCKAYRYKGT